ncbi:MAG: CHAT domain-containing protein [Candidatus Azotimanducaceae bacterium]|jgi:CHAT domain-containing protein
MLLHYILFDALYDGQNFLLENKAVRMLPSAADLKFVANGNQASKKQLVLDNPDLGDRKLDLKGAEQEAIAIAGNSPDANLLLRKRATRNRGEGTRTILRLFTLGFRRSV